MVKQSSISSAYILMSNKETFGKSLSLIKNVRALGLNPEEFQAH